MIEFDGLTKRYGSLVVVDNISMVIPAHTITAIVGTSGSGKSTLMRMVNRLVEPSAGTIRIDGQNISTLAPFELRRRIGYAIQNHGLFPHRSVAENIATVPRLLGWTKTRVAARVDELLALFQLEPGKFRERYPHELSGGQQQRVGVARALAAEPNILLMDEPFGALDPIIRAKAQEDLKAIQRKFGTTVLIVTHDMEEAIALGERIAVMDGGKLLQYATPAEMLVSPATDFVESLIGTRDKAFRLLSLMLAGDFAEPGAAHGKPVRAEESLRDALAELLWSRREAAPVTGEDGTVLGCVTREAILRQAGPPV
jgi:osmoprotectant transport system ATP-binding protein